MKEVRMEYSEYEAMVRTIEEQKEQIKNLLDSENVMLFEKCWKSGVMYYKIDSGKKHVEGKLESTIRRLNDDIRSLGDDKVQLEAECKRLYREERVKKIVKENKKSWWS